MVTMGLVYQVMHAAKKRNQNRKARMSKPKIDWKKTKFWRVTKIANPTSPRNPWLLQYEGPNAQGSLTFQSQDFRTKKEAQHFAQKAVDLGKAMP
jgi:hypothetical protein